MFMEAAHRLERAESREVRGLKIRSEECRRKCGFKAALTVKEPDPEDTFLKLRDLE